MTVTPMRIGLRLCDSDSHDNRPKIVWPPDNFTEASPDRLCSSQTEWRLSNAFPMFIMLHVMHIPCMCCLLYTRSMQGLSRKSQQRSFSTEDVSIKRFASSALFHSIHFHLLLFWATWNRVLNISCCCCSISNFILTVGGALPFSQLAPSPGKW